MIAKKLQKPELVLASLVIAELGEGILVDLHQIYSSPTLHRHKEWLQLIPELAADRKAQPIKPKLFACTRT